MQEWGSPLGIVSSLADQSRGFQMAVSMFANLRQEANSMDKAP